MILLDNENPRKNNDGTYNYNTHLMISYVEYKGKHLVLHLKK